jgi:hypothetical protein
MTGKVDRDLENVDPVLREKVTAMIEEAQRQGLDVSVYEGYRDPARQDDLYKQGKTKLQGTDGLNTQGFAADVTFHDSDGKRTWDAPKSDWERLGKIGKEHGLQWGGDWKDPDCAHFQLDKRDRDPRKEP